MRGFTLDFNRLRRVMRPCQVAVYFISMFLVKFEDIKIEKEKLKKCIVECLARAVADSTCEINF